jgi:signal peptidase I
MKEARRRRFRLPRANLVTLVFLCLGVACGTYLLREKVVEACHIPTPSMEPTLMGDEECGDRVFVNKLAFVLGEPHRFQVAVFVRDGEETNYIKRIVGMPRETILIRNGDLYVNGEILRKSQAVIHELSVPVHVGATVAELNRQWDVVSGQVRDAPGGLVLEGHGDIPLRLRLRDEVRDAYVNEHGGTIPGTKGVGDLRMTLEDLVATRGSRVLVRMREGNDQLEWRLDEREAIATLNGRVLLRSGTGILANTAHTLTLSNYDDRMSIEGVGEVLQGDYHGGLTRGPRENEVEIVVEGPGAQLRRLRLDRDIYYTETGRLGVETVHTVDDDSYFLLGDNSRDSRDSRAWGDVSRKNLVGAPFMIFWPLKRFRLL